MTIPTDADPVPRDAWLSEALRHAPDADAAPPSRVDNAVLRMGRAAVAPRTERSARPVPAAPIGPGWVERLGAAWSRLARPPVAAAFASLMVATVVGVMWWGRPLDETLPPREAPVPAAAAPAPASTDAPAVSAAAPDQAKATEPAAQVAAPRTQARSDAPARKAAPAPAAAKAAAPAADAQRDAAVAKAAPAGAAAQAANEAVAEATPRLRGSVERRELAVAPAAAPAAPLADAAPATSALGGLSARMAASTPIATPGLSNLRFEIRPRPQAWTWQRDDGAVREVDEALQGWIAQADRSTRAHWQAGASAGEAMSATLRFSRDGQVRVVLRLGPKGLRLDRGGKTESAELPAAQAAALIAALDALGR